MFKTKIMLFMLLGVFLIGCTPRIAPSYNPQNIMELEGQIFVKEFDYLPGHEIGHDLIPNNSIGKGFLLTEPVGIFFTDAVKKEFRSAGISLKNGKCKLEGEVHQLLVDDLGFFTSFTVYFVADVRYVLFDENNKYLLDKRYLTKFKNPATSGFTRTMLDNLNDMVSKNIGRFMESDDFIKNLQEHCS